MAKVDRIAGYFPSFYAPKGSNKLLYLLLQILALPLEEGDTTLFRIQRTHRLPVAEQVQDVLRLAGALNLTASHFEDILTQKDAAYSKKLEMVKDRIQRIAKLHLLGLGTPWAVLESAAIFLNAEIVPEDAGRPLVLHIDPDGYSHRSVIEFSYLPDKAREQVFLHENPLVRNKVDPEPRWNLNAWYTESKNSEPSRALISIQGTGDRTVIPSIFCPDAEEGILFFGRIPDGATLLIDESGAKLDQQSVDEWLLSFDGGIYDFSIADSSHFVVEQPAAAYPFEGKQRIFSRAFTSKKTVPEVLPGRYEWRYHSCEGVWNQHLIDYCVYATPGEPIGSYDHDFDYEASVYDFSPNAITGMAWDERIPCSFKLVLPQSAPQTQGAQSDPENSPEPSLLPVNFVGGFIPRFKAAGIRAYVDQAKDAWILGQSFIRAQSSTETRGTQIHSTKLLNEKIDTYVPLKG